MKSRKNEAHELVKIVVYKTTLPSKLCSVIYRLPDNLHANLSLKAFFDHTVISCKALKGSGKSLIGKLITT